MSGLTLPGYQSCVDTLNEMHTERLSQEEWGWLSLGKYDQRCRLLSAPRERAMDTLHMRHGFAVNGYPQTWTGNVVSLDAWRRLSERERHGPMVLAKRAGTFLNLTGPKGRTHNRKLRRSKSA
jgi:hypothetical protein